MIFRFTYINKHGYNANNKYCEISEHESHCCNNFSNNKIMKKHLKIQNIELLEKNMEFNFRHIYIEALFHQEKLYRKNHSVLPFTYGADRFIHDMKKIKKLITRL